MSVITYSCVVHRNIEDIYVLDNIILANILAEGTNRDTVRSVAEEVLD